MSKKHIWFWLNSGGASIPWWLAGGEIPESTDYTVYDPLAATDYNESLTNLANPGTRDASTTGTPPTFAAGEGWEFKSATSTWLSVNSPFTSAKTLVVWLEDCKSGVNYILGNSKIYYWPILSGSGTRIGTSSNLTLPWYSVGGIAAIRVGDGFYFNGKKFGTVPALAVGTDYDLYLGCRNNSGSPQLHANGKILRFALYDFVLSDAQLDALWLTMKNYQLPSVSGYSSQILALNPVAYYPCNQKYGQWLLDEINDTNFLVLEQPMLVGESGEDGYAIKGGGGVNNQFENYPEINFQTNTAINLDEFSYSFNIRNINANAQARPINIYSPGLAEYIALEIRSGSCNIYHKENGVTWNTTPGVAFPNDTWTKVVVTNSKISGKSTFYINGTKHEFTRTGTGFLNNTVANIMPFMIQSMTGYMNHIAFYNTVLNQTQVNSLL